VVLVMTPTKLNGFYDFVPPDLVLEGYHEAALKKLMDRQHRIIGDNVGKPKAERSNPAALVILDDCISERECESSHALRKVFTMGRHLHLSVIFTSQHITSRSYPPVMRVNTDYAVVAAQSSYDSTDIILETWMSNCEGGKDVARGAFNTTTRECAYQFLVIDCRAAAAAHSLNQFCYKYKAPGEAPPKFRMCAQRFWHGWLRQVRPEDESMWQRFKSRVSVLWTDREE
jgi:hypothetical protein